ncbi:polyprenyl synthetase family protein [Amycolatopsis sp. H20-H5]|uniref:polyprenyl synthetase family protein n=1 Tax=Amycolatopsis sp. H20-H5 TaxID=3046309 RepID=UPI002DC03D6C|nr:polyprenyl synthetase family protein [Amycolatopsis sp. H20-H5]MEC3982491.1 polyprenyl synthetase family protein [Amycolatopsis sp. H20-H5]
MAVTADETAELGLEPAEWLTRIQTQSRRQAHDYVRERCDEQFTGREEGALALTALPEFVAGGKFLRPAFAYVGWSCGRAGDDRALRAVASLELLHCFALAQDDVMDASSLRRGRPALRTALAQWHRRQRWQGSPNRFGDSAATLFGDLFLVWAEQMLRESGVGAKELGRAWPHYDAMRTELAVGQLADLVNDAGAAPSWASVVDVIRRKSGNYTVRRPLEFGAAMAGCDAEVIACLGRYGGLLGEAFQFRDDVLGVFGDPEVTGKPVGEDLRERKATSLVVLASDLADHAQSRALRELARLEVVDADAIARWQRLIVDTGAPDRMELLIAQRVTRALAAIDAAVIPPHSREALVLLAAQCTERVR